MADEREVDRIVAEWCSRTERGKAEDPAEVIRAHPEHADALRRRFEAQRLLDRAVGNRPSDAPSEIGDYYVVREIGRGGMGVVYEAKQKRMKRKVALKVLTASITSTPQAVKRFQREAQAAGRLHHTNIVPVYDLDQFAGQWYYAMELVEGRSLSEVIADLRGRRPTERQLARIAVEQSTLSSDVLSGTGTGDRSYYTRVAALFAGVADALELAHQEGIVHRDVKPSNLLLDADGVLKVVDFGLARFDDEALSMTMTGDLLGTPQYMSPEQAMAKRMGIDHRTDIYSLGATLYEVLTLEPPFDADNLQQLCSQIITKDPALPRKKNQRVPKDLETIVCKAMEKDRDKRYQSARDFARDLRAFAEGGAIRARRIGVVGRAWRQAKRRPVRASLVAALLVVVVTGGVLAMQLGHATARESLRRYRVLCARGWSAAYEYEDAWTDPTRPFTEAIAILPNRPEAYLGRALNGAVGASALKDVEEARAFGLDVRSYHLARADLYGRMSSWEDAKAEHELASRVTATTALHALLEGRLLRFDKHAEAADAYSRAIRLAGDGDPIGFIARRLRSYARERLGDFEGAIADLVSVRAAGDASLRTRLRIATLWRRLGRQDTATAKFEGVLREMSEQPDDQLGQMFQVIPEYYVDWCHAFADAWMLRLPQSSGARRAKALALHRSNRPTEALRVLEPASGGGAEHLRALLLLGVGRKAAALSEARKVKATHPERCSCHLIRILIALGQLDEAQRVATEEIVRRPYHETAFYERARVHEAANRPGDAIRDLDRALAIDPSSTASLYKKAVLLAATGSTEQGIGLLERVLHFAPESATTLKSLALLLNSVGQHNRALDSIDRALQLEGDNASYLIARGDVLWAAGRRKEALADYIKATEVDPNLPLAWQAKGRVLFESGRYDEALAAYEKAIELDPKMVWAQVGRGLALWGLGRVEDARESFERAISVDPEHQPAHFNLGIILLQDGGYEQALASLNRCLSCKADPRGNLGEGRIHRWRTCCLAELGRLKEALEAHEKAVAGGVEDAHQTHRLAWLLATTPLEEERVPAKAVELARRAIELRAKGGSVENTLGVALYRAGDWQECIDVLTECDTKQASAGNRFFIAMARHRLGQENAREWFEKGVAWMDENKPDDADLKRFRTEAEELLGVKTEGD